MQPDAHSRRSTRTSTSWGAGCAAAACPQHLLNGWEPIVTQVIGHRLLDTWETTAMRTMITFYSQHPLEVLLSVFGLFSVHDPADPLWRDRMANVATVATLDPVGALRTVAECLNTLYCLQISQSQAIA